MMPAGSCSLVSRGHQCNCDIGSKRSGQSKASGREEICELWGQVSPKLMKTWTVRTVLYTYEGAHLQSRWAAPNLS